jgi:two-component system OmpR family response regulator
MSRHVLVVDDEPRIREVVTYALRRDGYVVSEAEAGDDALARMAVGGVDLVVLDVMLPGADGLEVCRRLRASSRVPILFLSAKGEEVDRVVGLEIGGDDYLVKPFSPRELVARVRALLRRADAPSDLPAAAAAGRVLVHGPIEVDLDRHEVRCGGAHVALTPTELGVLATLLERPGVVCSRAVLMQRAYRWDNLVTERTIDTHVRRIRAKFRPTGIDPVATVHGVGYKVAELASPV